MAKPTTVKEAVKRFEDAQGVDATEAERVRSSPRHIDRTRMCTNRSSCGVRFRRSRKWMRRCRRSRTAREMIFHVHHVIFSRHCRYLSLSSNNIDKISSLSGMEKLRVLSLGRNVIKKIENLDGVIETIEELWISYNQLEKLVSGTHATIGVRTRDRCRPEWRS